jgi:hypothetical protein
MTTPIENRHYWDTPKKAILSTLVLSFVILTAISVIPLTLNQTKNNQELRSKADTIYTTPLITPISSNQVVISFSTTIPVTSQINLNSPSDKQTLPISKDLQNSHVITLKNLDKKTSYTFNLSLTPVKQNAITTDNYQFTTPQ